MSEQISFVRSYIAVLVFFTIVINMIMFMRIIPQTGPIPSVYIPHTVLLPSVQGTLVSTEGKVFHQDTKNSGAAALDKGHMDLDQVLNKHKEKKPYFGQEGIKFETGEHVAEIVDSAVAKKNLSTFISDDTSNDRQKKVIENIIEVPVHNAGKLHNMYDNYKTKGQAPKHEGLPVEKPNIAEQRQSSLLYKDTEAKENNIKHQDQQKQPKQQADIKSKNLQGFNADYIRNFWKQRNSNEILRNIKNIEETNKNLSIQTKIKPAVQHPKGTTKVKELTKNHAVGNFKTTVSKLDVMPNALGKSDDRRFVIGHFDLGAAQPHDKPTEPKHTVDDEQLSFKVIQRKNQEDHRQLLRNDKPQTNKKYPIPVNKEFLNKTLITAFPPRGQLGNQMFQLASLLGIAETGNFTPFLRKEEFLIDKIFDVPDNIYQDIDTSTFDHFSDDNDTDGRSITLSKQLDTRRSWVLDGYFQSYKYFWPVQNKLRKYLTIRKSWLQMAERMIEQNVPEGHTKVAIHVRRGDFISSYQMKLGRLSATPEYINKAMKLFTAKYFNITFLVVSDDMKWCLEHIKSDNVKYMSSGKTGVDLAIMSLCNHVIITVGTFGWWGGWLSGGTVVYFKAYPRLGSELGKTFMAENYYPENWIGLE